MLDTIKTLLGFDLEAANAELDAKLKAIISIVQSRLMLLLGGVEEVPETLEHIVIEVSVIRFNKIGSEGVSSHTVEGESLSFSENDFAAYADEIPSTKGVL